MGGGAGRGLKQTVDWKLVVCYLILLVIGMANIYASIHSSEPSSVFAWSARSGKQAVWIATSFVLATLILFVINPRLWEVLSTPMYIAVLGLLVAVIFLGVEVKGSRSWFAFGPIRFQPAEVSKISTSLLLSAVMSRQGFKLSRPRDLLLVALIVGLPMLVIIGESETGSALVYVGFLFVLYREGLSGWYIFVVGMAILLFIVTLTSSFWLALALLLAAVAVFFFVNRSESGRSPLARRRNLLLSLGGLAAGLLMIFSTQFVFNNVLQDHQRKRIEVLLGMKEDPSGVGYNVTQSMIAIGSGGFSGKGYLRGTQTTYGFVPEQSTDFIFCTVGEEWGFLGCAFVILLYAYLIYRIVKDAEKSREQFTRIYGYCVASCIFMHLFINIGMTIGLMPVIGIPLPLLSYGGSSLWAFTILIFIFIALDRQENKYF